jgi:hypothetical protein
MPQQICTCDAYDGKDKGAYHYANPPKLVVSRDVATIVSTPSAKSHSGSLGRQNFTIAITVGDGNRHHTGSYAQQRRIGATIVYPEFCRISRQMSMTMGSSLSGAPASGTFGHQSPVLPNSPAFKGC